MTPDEFLTLEALSRRAAEHSLAATGSHIDEDDRADSLALHLLEAGIRAWERFDPDVYADVRRETYAYRAMRGYRGGTFTEGPAIDWLRRTVRDRRFEPEVSTVLTADGSIPELDTIENDPSLRFALRTVGGRLSERSRETLERLVAPVVLEDGVTLPEAAKRAGIPLADAVPRIAELRDELVAAGFRILELDQTEQAPALIDFSFDLIAA